ncbi:MAG: hypothetical protein O3C63_01190 [Cyanobacteria bacterium]|nr:hypothetical protein [Cyanobacteriota bacterium]MDA1021104.1 hypothetical protein [Cyanobacteriota bacterium]
METLNRAFSFGQIWDKSNLVKLLRGTNIYSNKHKPADFIRQALISMVARLQKFMSMVSSLPADFVQNFSWDLCLDHNSTQTCLTIGSNDAYSFKFVKEDFQGPTSPRRQSQSNRESDHSYSMTLKPFNLKLTKEIIIAKADEDGNNKGGWEPGSFIHTISLDEADKIESDKNRHPLVLEIGVRLGYYDRHELWTKVIHKADEDSSGEDIVIEDRFPNTDAFKRSLDIDFHSGFFPQSEYD